MENIEIALLISFVLIAPVAYWFVSIPLLIAITFYVYRYSVKKDFIKTRIWNKLVALLAIFLIGYFFIGIVFFIIFNFLKYLDIISNSGKS
jgi:hypothetical protein